MVDFNTLIIIVAMVTVAVMLCIFLTHEDKVYVLEYEHCLYDMGSTQHYRVVARIECFFSTKTKTIFVPYRGNKQQKHLKEKLEFSLKNGTSL